jgi:TonB family protein
MKTKLLLTFVFTLPLLAARMQAQTATQPGAAPCKTYTIKGEDFSVSLPLLPARHTDDEYIDNFRKRRRVYSLGVYADGVVYVIFVFENPESLQALSSFLKSQKGANMSITDLTLDGISGKETRSEDGILRSFATRDRIYVFGAMGAPLDDPRMTSFLSSLSLRKNKDSIEVDDGPGEAYTPVQQAQASTPDSSEKLFTVKEVDTKLRLAMKPEPSYTEKARQKVVTGTVVLKCIFRSNGSVTDISTISGLRYGLTERAIDAARKIKFIPAMKDGKFVSVWMQLEYNFNLY